MDPTTINWGPAVMWALINAAIASALLGALVAATSALVGANNGESWRLPAHRWFRGVSSWFWERVFGSSEKRKLIADFRALRDQEDAEYSRRIAERMGPEDRARLVAARRQALKERAEDVVGVDTRTAISTIVWVLALLALIPAIGGSWFLKFQVGREFLTGSENLAGIPIVIGGNLVNITAVHVICGLMVLIELVVGILLHLSIERLEQIKKGQISEGTAVYRVMLWGSLVLISSFFLLEALMGYVRGTMETGGDGFGTVFIIGVSVFASVITVALAFILKSQFKHAAPFLSWGLRIPLGLVGLVVLVIPISSLLIGAGLAGVAYEVAERRAQAMATLREQEAAAQAKQHREQLAAEHAAQALVEAEGRRLAQEARTQQAQADRDAALARRRQVEAEARKAQAEAEVAEAELRKVQAEAEAAGDDEVVTPDPGSGD